VELPHPEVLIERLTDPRIQAYLGILPQYRKVLDSDQFRHIQAVVNLVATQLGTTWDRALRDLTGGGILAAIEADAGKEPRFCLVITPRDPGLLERAHQVLLKMARQDAKDKKKPDLVRTSEYRGLVVYSPGGEKGGAYALVAGKLAISNTPGNLQRLLDRHLDAGTPGSQPGAARPGPPWTRIADQPDWKQLRDRQGADAVAWGYANLDKLRALDAKRFKLPEKGDTGVILFFGSWYEALRQAPLVIGGIRWSESEFGATLELPLARGGRPAMLKGYVPAAGQGSAPPIRPPGTIAALSLWRDWATLWESRAELFAPEVAQGLAQLDTFAGQFFGVREFGSDVLGAFDPHWRLVIAGQDHRAMNPAPDVKLPAFALVAELESADSDFAQRLKVAFQSFVGLVNIGSAQQKGPLLELGSEEVEGITIATTRYMVPRPASGAGVPPHQRYNYSPSAAQVGKFFILSSSTPLARSLVKELKADGRAQDAGGEDRGTLTVEADGPELARLLEHNRTRLVMQAMLNQGETRAKAEERIGLYLALVRYLGRGRLVMRDEADATRFEVKLNLSKSTEKPR
jgi:hypothetical protein